MMDKRFLATAVVLVASAAALAACRAAPIPTPSPAASPTIALPSPPVPPTATVVPAPTGQPSSPDERLTTPIWLWVSYTGGKGVEERIKTPEKYQVRFLADGRVQIKADCNSVRATYSVEGNRLDLKDMVATKVACAPGSLSDLFVANVQMVFAYAFENGDLLLILRMDGGELRFSPAR